jgi:chorismate mutase
MNGTEVRNLRLILSDVDAELAQLRHRRAAIFVTVSELTRLLDGKIARTERERAGVVMQMRIWERIERRAA